MDPANVALHHLLGFPMANLETFCHSRELTVNWQNLHSCARGLSYAAFAVSQSAAKKDADDDVTVFLRIGWVPRFYFQRAWKTVASLTIEGMPRGWYLHRKISIHCRCLALYSSNSCEEAKHVAFHGWHDPRDTCQDACSRAMYIYKMCI